MTIWALVIQLVSVSPELENEDFSFFDETLQSLAQDDRAVVQNRRFVNEHELTLRVGGFPADAFNRGVSAGAGYTLHFNDHWAWEVAQGRWSFNFNTNLQDEVLRFRQAEFPAVEGVVASNLVFKPLYAKEAFFNTSVVYLEVQLHAGPAAVLRSDDDSQWRPGADLGFAIRLWLNETWSTRLEVSDVLYVVDESLEQALNLHIGLSYNLRFDS